MKFDHWCRHVMNETVAQIVRLEGPQNLDVLEVSGDAWADFGFRSYRILDWPEHDICDTRLRERFDLIIAEQVFEHIRHPLRAARNIRAMLRPGGMILVTTPFLIKYHPAPLDVSRWTHVGMAALLDDAGFVDIHTDSWGNKECLIANLDEWVDFEPGRHSLANDPQFPVSVWGTGRRPSRVRAAKRRAGHVLRVR